MDGHAKKFLHHWRKKYIKTWQILLFLALALTSTIFFLRQNNLKMVELRNQVVQADKQGGDIAGALKKLNTHVFAHMNTQIVRPIELVNTYNREAQVAIIAANSGSGRDIYAEATAACERRGVPLSSIAQCAADFAVTNNPSTGPQQIKLPDKNLFIHTFATPLWTADLAGFSLIITGVVFVWLGLRLIEYVLVRIIVRNRLTNGF